MRGPVACATCERRTVDLHQALMLLERAVHVIEQLTDTEWRPGLTMADMERSVLWATLAHCEGNITKAAETLGVDRRTVQRAMRRATA